MQATRYKVVCNNCKGKSTVTIIDGRTVAWEDVNEVISARKRLDDNWGWQCTCGNDDLMTKQERKQIKNHQSPNPVEINEVIKNLIPQKPKFRMVAG